MSIGPAVESSANGVLHVRELLLTALHFGRFKPGDRAPSVRRLAMVTGMNRKTVHRAYRKLADEGILAVRRGSGTFFADVDSADSPRPAVAALLKTLDHCRLEAQRLGLDEGVFGRFVGLAMNGRMSRVPVAVCECNREQVGLLGREIGEALGAPPRRVLLSDLVIQPVEALGSCRAVVTTDCHRDEVLGAVAGLGVSVHRIALERAFTDTLVLYARRQPLVMVVADARYGPIFLRMLRQLAVPEEVVGRFRIVEPAALEDATVDLDRGYLYVSPLVERESIGRPRAGLRRVRAGCYLSEASLTALRAEIALDVAAAETGERISREVDGGAPTAHRAAPIR